MATELTNPQTDRTPLSAERPYFEVSKAVGFEAAHRLLVPGKEATYGRIHGHSFRLEATLGGSLEEGQDWIEDLAVLTQALERIAGELDHGLLNDVKGLERPTLENIALWVAERLQRQNLRLIRVTLERPSLNERCVLKL